MWREFYEETGLRLVIDAVFGTYADPGRDPRGNYVSTVFIGSAHGKLRNEAGKTKVWILGKNEIVSLEDSFAFDHYKILEQFFQQIQK
ncbi:MAG: NUDIX domain-containing protein [Candidatus Falkowbacteria bacterium]